MIKLTKRETKQTIQAAADIETQFDNLSCCALEWAHRYESGFRNDEIVCAYRKMFGLKDDEYVNETYDLEDFTDEDLRHLRVMMLLTFAEVCGE